jgi:hypothetical protein
MSKPRANPPKALQTAEYRGLRRCAREAGASPDALICPRTPGAQSHGFTGLITPQRQKCADTMEKTMTKEDRNTQHSANGVGGSNNPAANPGQAKPGKPLDEQAGQPQPVKQPAGESGKKGNRD